MMSWIKEFLYNQKCMGYKINSFTASNMFSYARSCIIWNKLYFTNYLSASIIRDSYEVTGIGKQYL
jgi:hypothetical protein